eukprot:1581751-Prymnesium_polylepis.1
MEEDKVNKYIVWYNVVKRSKSPEILRLVDKAAEIGVTDRIHVECDKSDCNMTIDNFLKWEVCKPFLPLGLKWKVLTSYPNNVSVKQFSYNHMFSIALLKKYLFKKYNSDVSTPTITFTLEEWDAFRFTIGPNEVIMILNEDNEAEVYVTPSDEPEGFELMDSDLEIALSKTADREFTEF